MKQVAIFQNITQVDKFLLDPFLCPISPIQCMSRSKWLYFEHILILTTLPHHHVLLNN